jgi:hypothetical protein
VAYHIFRTTRGGTAVGGASDALTIQAVRLRTFKWLRRALAQINIAPKLVDMVVEIISPPPPNMIVISPDTGVAPSGASFLGAGRFGTGESSLSLTLTPLLVPPTFPNAAVTVNLGQVPAPKAPVDVGNALIGALPAGFSGVLAVNPPAFNAVNGSCDVIITRGDGALVAITNETLDDDNIDFQIAVPRIVGTIHPQGPGLGPVLRVLEDEPRAALVTRGPEALPSCVDAKYGPGSRPALRSGTASFMADVPIQRQAPESLRRML